MITPTIGRIVWYYPGDMEMATSLGDQPMVAIVTYVHSDTRINVAYWDHNGAFNSSTSVELIQDQAPPSNGAAWCEWMPYQKGQAAKYEQLEREKAQ